MMRHYIYQPSSDSASRQFFSYTMAALAFRGSEYVAFVLLETFLVIHYRLLVVGVSVVATIAKFFVYRVIFEGLKKPEASWPELVSNS